MSGHSRIFRLMSRRPVLSGGLLAGSCTLVVVGLVWVSSSGKTGWKSRTPVYFGVLGSEFIT